MGDALCKLAEIQFFFSSITGVTRNKKRKRSTECEKLNEGKDASLSNSNSLINQTSKNEKSSQSSSHADSSEAVIEEPDFYPAIAYIVPFTEREHCNTNKIFQVLHESETIAQVRQIASRSKKPNTNQVANDLFNVLKGHNNPAIETIVKKSNEVCFYKALIKRADLEMDFWGVYRESDVPDVPLCTSKRPSRLVVASKEEYEIILKNISRKLCQAGLYLTLYCRLQLCAIYQQEFLHHQT